MTESSYHVLSRFLDSDSVPDGCYDYIQTHGFLSAMAISPQAEPMSTLMEEIFNGVPKYSDVAQQQLIETHLTLLLDAMSRQLYSGEAFTIPCALQLGKRPEQAPIRGWAIGFMEAVGLQEELWFGTQEEEVGELILPIVVASGLFDDKELQDLARDPQQSTVLLQQIPEHISELYLLFRDDIDAATND